MARLPLCGPEELQAELDEISRDRRRLDSAVVVCPERARERRDCLDRWETDLREQLAEMTR